MGQPTSISEWSIVLQSAACCFPPLTEQCDGAAYLYIRVVYCVAISCLLFLTTHGAMRWGNLPLYPSDLIVLQSAACCFSPLTEQCDGAAYLYIRVVYCVAISCLLFLTTHGAMRWDNLPLYPSGLIVLQSAACCFYNATHCPITAGYGHPTHFPLSRSRCHLWTYGKVVSDLRIGFAFSLTIKY